jgi:hypothetical protein
VDEGGTERPRSPDVKAIAPECEAPQFRPQAVRLPDCAKDLCKAFTGKAVILEVDLYVCVVGV